MLPSFDVTLPDSRYYEDEVECRFGCPVKTDARGYLLAVTAGEYREGYAIARATNPFASICGQVCGAPCEKTCRRGKVDDPVAIRNMKGFLTDRFGPESGDLLTPLTYAKVPGSTTPTPNGRRVAVIGGGAAGYTCAHDLARLGYQVTIFERHHISGGMLVQGVPVNRLNRETVQAEIDSILKLGLIDVIHGADVGNTHSFARIREEYDAVFIGVGLCQGRIIPIPGHNHPAVHPGLQFLLDFNFGTRWFLEGKRTIVIGGGDVAFDVARSALRCGSPEVNLCCLERESLGEMTSSRDEREGGRREGVIINDGWGPDEIMIENGIMKGMRIKKVLSVLNEEKRFAPTFVEGEDRIVEGDILFMAVGQTSDLAFLEGSDVNTERGLIVGDQETGKTSAEDVFAGGDILLGPKLFIDAIESGSRAARSIDAWIQSKPRLVRKRVIKFTDYNEYDRNSRYVDLAHADREELHVDPAWEPSKITTVEYPPEAAHDQSLRCLACHIHPTFEGNICILCGGCVDVCPSYCLRMVHISRVQGNNDVKRLIVGEFGDVDLSKADGSVMLFDNHKCIRCGMCSIKCPTGACKMSVNEFEDQWVEENCHDCPVHG